nr:MAG TPA: hypothetical protein [Caudoviricetes sp.]
MFHVKQCSQNRTLQIERNSYNFYKILVAPDVFLI